MKKILLILGVIGAAVAVNQKVLEKKTSQDMWAKASDKPDGVPTP